MNARARLAAALAATLAALPVAAYLLPTSAVLKRLAQRREDLGLRSLEVRGTFTASGDAARAVAATLGIPLVGPELSAPARLALKMPGRCRLELVPPDVVEASRPSIVVRQGKVSGARGLDRVDGAASLAQGVCALLGERAAGPDADRAWADALQRLGVTLGDVHLGRSDARIAYVLGARPTEKKPQAWVDKQTFQPVRVVFARGSGLADVRLLDFGSATGGDWFPRAVEAWGPGGLEARLTTEKVVANPRLPDALF